MVWLRILVRATGVLAPLAALAGCSAAEKQAEHHVTGPWSSEIAAMFDESTSEFVRGVLEDGVISDREVAEMRDRYERCLSASGIVLTSFAHDGATEITFPPTVSPERAHDTMAECSRSSGEYPIGALSSWMQRNPEHRDEDTIMAECLVAHGVVPSDYRAADYAMDTTSGSWPFQEQSNGRDALEACVADPFGLVVGR